MLKQVDRHCDQSLVIIPGWGFDWRIFERLDLPYNYVFYTGNRISACTKALSALMNETNALSYSLLGWSQGAFAACDLCRDYAHRIERLVLIGVRQAYTQVSLDNMLQRLRKNQRGMMLGFYRACFRGHDAACFRWFKQTLLAPYLQELSLSRLEADLHWLRQARIQPEHLRGVKKVTVVQGALDEIAPLAEAEALTKQCQQARLVTLDPCGHLPFLLDDFAKHIHDC
jgi:pimeloyl-ACP methyl ester carboxylesterase